MKVLIVPNYSRPDAVEGARSLESWLDGQGIEAKWAHDKKLFPSRAVDASDCNLVVSLGGDGTLLRAARIVGYSGTPILGISYGHLGFLTSAGPADLIATVGEALAGELHVSHRATLDIESEFVRTDGSTYSVRSFALNDFALSRGGHGDIVEFDVSVSGIHIDRLRGDGFVVSTATGSTGYALAAGGPIVTPEFGGMVCVPVAPHTIMARAFLTSPSDVVEIDMSPERPAMRHFFADLASRCAARAVRACAPSSGAAPGTPALDRSTQSFYDSVSRVSTRDGWARMRRRRASPDRGGRGGSTRAARPRRRPDPATCDHRAGRRPHRPHRRDGHGQDGAPLVHKAAGGERADAGWSGRALTGSASRADRSSRRDEDGTVVRRGARVQRRQSRPRGDRRTHGQRARARRARGSTVDLCGQHEHQRLLAVQTHAELLDAWAGLAAEGAPRPTSDALAAASARPAVELERIRELGRATGEKLEEAAFALRRIDEVNPGGGA